MKKSVGAQTIIHPNPVLIIGTYDEKGQPNMMNAAWGGICCSKPPCAYASVRKPRYTYNNIVKNKAFTINIPSIKHFKEADYVGIYSGRKENKFEATGLTPMKSDICNAPIVKEFPFALECKLLHSYELGIHTQFVGEILDIKADEEILGENGLPDIEKVKPMLYANGNSAYYGVGEFVAKAFSVGKK